MNWIEESTFCRESPSFKRTTNSAPASDRPIVPEPPVEPDPADEHGGEDIELELVARSRVGTAGAAERDESGKNRDQRREDEHEADQAVDADPVRSAALGFPPVA